MIETMLAARCVTQIEDVLLSRGIKLEYGSDFKFYNSTVSETRGPENISPPFDSSKHFLNEDNSYWIIARDSLGAVIHTQAMKSVDLKSATLGEYLVNFYSEFSPAGLDIDFKSSHFSLSPGAKIMTGNLFYHGDIWLANTPIYRGTGLMKLLGRLISLMTYLRWRADFIFGFVPEGLAYSGASVRESYAHNEPDVLQLKAVSGKRLNGFMVWNSLEDIEYSIQCGIDHWLSTSEA